MSVFGTIVSKILGRTPTSPAATVQAAPSAQAGTTTAAAAPAATPAPPSAASTPPGPPVDVAAVLDALNDNTTQELDWKRSIVDLMKLLSLDSSLAARKELAKELHYGGDTGDSATMNVWLHKQIMVNLAANGGKLPDELKNLT
jgi:3-oxoacyl-ACP reductase-like protein